MQRTIDLLASAPLRAPDRFPLAWSDAYRENLRETAEKGINLKSPIDAALAPSLLKASEGYFLDAERDALEVLRNNISLCQKNEAVFVTLLSTLFSIQRFDLVVAMLADRHSFPAEFEIDVKEGAPHPACLRWEISSSGSHRFTFDPRVFETDETAHEVRKLHWVFPLYARYARTAERETGSVIANHFDLGVMPGLAWSDSRPDRFLVPDCVFVPTKGYSHVREQYKTRPVDWNNRRPVAFWRGATTGARTAADDWRSLERIKLCELARKHQNTGLIDAGISSVVQFSGPAVREIEKSGLMLDEVPWQDWNGYKYQIDIDGNTNAWSGFFQRLLTASPVLKVESSRGLLQWYYDDLRPWQNYVPVAADTSDLMDKIRWLNRNDRLAQEIGHRGFQLADELSYERELQRSVPVISAAFRYSNGHAQESAPYGRMHSSRTLIFARTF